MSEQAKVWYDKEGDFLEITTETKKGSFKAIGNDIFERVDEKGKPIGVAIFNFLKRFEKGAAEIPLPIMMTLKKVLA